MGVNASIEGSNPSFSVPRKASNSFAAISDQSSERTRSIATPRSSLRRYTWADARDQIVVLGVVHTSGDRSLDQLPTDPARASRSSCRPSPGSGASRTPGHSQRREKDRGNAGGSTKKEVPVRHWLFVGDADRGVLRGGRLATSLAAAVAAHARNRSAQSCCSS
jgi:hypothetical protein